MIKLKGVKLGVLEVIQSDAGSLFKSIVLDPEEEYRPPRGGFMLIEVEDVDRLYQSVLEQGVEVLQGIKDWSWEFRDFKVTDPCGNIVCLFSRLPGWEEHH